MQFCNEYQKSSFWTKLIFRRWWTVKILASLYPIKTPLNVLFIREINLSACTSSREMNPVHCSAVETGY